MTAHAEEEKGKKERKRAARIEGRVDDIVPWEEDNAMEKFLGVWHSGRTRRGVERRMGQAGQGKKPSQTDRQRDKAASEVTAEEQHAGGAADGIQ